MNGRKILIVEDNRQNMRLRHNAEFSRVPILALTAHAMKGDREKIIGAGCNAYLAKPFDTRRLPDLIERALRGTPADSDEEVSSGEDNSGC